MTALAAPLELYEGGLVARRLSLLCRDGTRTALPVTRWLDDPRGFDRDVLRRVTGPVLDVGCGPGRHLAALQRRGTAAHGIDLSPSAVRTARRRATDVQHGSVFGLVHGAGTFATALLLDGNIGIGGDEVALLHRVAELLAPGGGEMLVEVDPPGAGTRREPVRLELGRRRSAWFPWARVDVEGVVAAAVAAGLRVSELYEREARWLAVVARR